MSASVTAALPAIPKVTGAPRVETKYTATCAALRVKPNSQIVACEEMLDGAHVDLSSNYLGGSGFEAVTHILAQSKVLETLNVSDNGLHNESVVFFCRAVADHLALRIVDLSRNPLSLPAGLAVLDLVHKNKRIAEVRLSETQIDEAVLRRIKRALNLNKNSHAAAPPANGSVPTPFQRVKKEHEERQAAKQREAAQARNTREAAAPEGVARWIADRHVVGPQRTDDGWAAVNVCVACTPNEFVTECALIQDVIVPALNSKFRARKVYFYPLFMFNDLPPHHHRDLPLQQQQAIRADHAANVAKSTPFFVQLIGDRVGLSEFTKDSAAPPSAILHREYELAGDGCSVIMMRCPALQLHVPPPLMPLVSSDPQLVHPDPNTHVVKVAVAAVQGRQHPQAGFDIHTEQQKWQAHQAFKKKVLASHPAAFVCSGWRPHFAGVTANGHLRLEGHDEFTAGLQSRLEAAADALYPDQPAAQLSTVSRWTGAATVQLRQLFLTACTERCVGRRNLLGKLDLYAVTPPSRNVTLVYGAAGSGLTSAMGAFVQRCVKKPSYVVAQHFTHQSALAHEPSDPRTVFLSLASQLMPDGEVPSHVRNAVDATIVKEFFVSTLAAAATDLADTKSIIIVIDGLDDIDPVVAPCAALRVSDTGVDMWQPTLPPTSASPSPMRPPTRHNDGFDYIPMCLARNVRWVASCQAFSQTHRRLEARGHDSCEPIPIGEIGDNDVELVVAAALAPFGIALSEEEHAVLRSKDDCHVHDYLRFVVDRLRHQEEVPGSYMSRLALLHELPHTLPEMCQQRINSLESEFGAGLVRQVCGILIASRWGVTEMELQELLAKPTAATRIARARPRLPGEVFNRLLRRMAPVLQPYVASKASTSPCGVLPMNAAHMIVRIQCRTFIAEARARFFADPPLAGAATAASQSGVAAPAAASKDALQAIHQHLAHYYARLASEFDHPLEAKAVKEMAFHAIQGRMWAMVEESVVSLSFISQAYKHKLGYQAARELISAFNTVESASVEEIPNKKALLHKISEYVYFVRDHNVNLAQYPHMVRQIAVTCSAESHLHQDAKAFFKSKGTSQSHFLVVNKSKAKLHRDAITACCFAPSGMRIATCSDDRSIKICNLTGESVININQSSSKLKLLRYSPTSRYLVAVAEDRTTFVMDATNGNLVSKFSGHSSAIRSVTTSARGRFIATASEDRTLRIWEAETGAHLCSVQHHHYSHHTSAYGGVNLVVAHPFEEDKFFVMCDKKALGWRLANSREHCDEFLCITGHNTLPLASIHVVADGGFLITTAKDLAATPANFTRAEDSIKVFSIHTGRCVALLTNGMQKGGCGPILSAVSLNEKLIASALFDATVQLHHLHVRSYAPEADEPVTVTPFCHFTGFRGHPVGEVTHLCFSFDSSLLCAAGNQRQLKLWATTPPADNTPTIGPGNTVRATATLDKDDTAKSPIFTATCDTAVRVPEVAEFLMEQQCLSLDWTQTPGGEDVAELIVGDVVGRLHALRLKYSQ